MQVVELYEVATKTAMRYRMTAKRFYLYNNKMLDMMKSETILSMTATANVTVCDSFS